MKSDLFGYLDSYQIFHYIGTPLTIDFRFDLTFVKQIDYSLKARVYEDFKDIQYSFLVKNNQKKRKFSPYLCAYHRQRKACGNQFKKRHFGDLLGYQIQRRADVFFRLKQGEFITFADGKDKRVQFKLQNIQKGLPKRKNQYSSEDLRLNFERIYKEVNLLFKRKGNQ